MRLSATKNSVCRSAAWRVELGERLAVLPLRHDRAARGHRAILEAAQPVIHEGEPVALLGELAFVDDVEPGGALLGHHPFHRRAQRRIVGRDGIESGRPRQAAHVRGQNRHAGETTSGTPHPAPICGRISPCPTPPPAAVLTGAAAAAAVSLTPKSAAAQTPAAASSRPGTHRTNGSTRCPASTARSSTAPRWAPPARACSTPTISTSPTPGATAQRGRRGRGGLPAPLRHRVRVQRRHLGEVRPGAERRGVVHRSEDEAGAHEEPARRRQATASCPASSRSRRWSSAARSSPCATWRRTCSRGWSRRRRKACRKRSTPEFVRNLIPNSHLMAAGVVAVNRAQEYGYTLLTAI